MNGLRRRRIWATAGAAACALFGLPAASTAAAQTATGSTVQWSIAQLEKALAATPPGQDVQLGDMFLSRAIVEANRDILAGRAPKVDGVTRPGVTFWPGGNVIYRFDAGVSAAHKEHFLDAAAEWAAFANLRFVLRTTEANFITVFDVPGLNGGNSFVGMRGGEQALNMGSNSWRRSTIVHEIGHALGFFHEHQRSDRDAFVVILTANIALGMEGNFTLLPTSTNYGAYDFLSVMHYSREGASVDTATKNTIEPKPAYAAFLNEMGRQFDRPLSRQDRATVAVPYGAPTVAPSAVVTSTKDSGTGSLRAAIYHAFDRADAVPGTTTGIQFRIPSSDPNFDGNVFTIRPTAVLPALGDGTTVDGQTQTAFNGNTNPAGPEVVINGAKLLAAEQPSTGVVMRGANSAVRNVVVNGFGQHGVRFRGAGSTGNALTGSYVGTDRAGTATVPNVTAGVYVSDGAHGNTIGGTVAGAGNVLSGNTGDGVMIFAAGTSSNTVAGNLVGLNVAGTAALANGSEGVSIFGGATANTVGPGNTISGNVHGGIGISQAGTDANVVTGNRIGTNAAGDAAVPNQSTGAAVFGGAKSNRVGGSAVGEGNLVAGNSGPGVSFRNPGSSLNVAAGNVIGLNAAGTAALPNSTGVSISLAASSNTVGPGNTISGNTNSGVAIGGPGTDATVVIGNRIGTDPAGSAALANSNGVSLYDGAQNNRIGGTTAAERNTLSGNTYAGVSISQANTRLNTVVGNYIGLRSSGVEALANGGNGVQISREASDNTIGGTVAGSRNYVSGNLSTGVSILDTGTRGNRIHGNTLGLNKDGAPTGNGSRGAVVFLGASANEIGGTAPGAGNVISANTAEGVGVYDAATTGNPILGNSISANSQLGINLGGGTQIGGGVTVNDSGDGDSGPNLLQNHPVVMSAATAVGTRVRGTLNSGSTTTFRIEVFSSPTADPTGYGEAATFRGAITLTTDGGGNGSFTMVVSPAVPVGHFVSATATDPAGNTSELALNRTVVRTSPVAADFDADGDTDLSVFRPSSSQWFAQGSAPVSFGTTGDIPVPADYDADGDTEVAVFRPSVGGWFRSGGPTSFFGVNGDVPVPADYDGDGDVDLAVFRPSVGGWYVEGKSPVFFGLAGDIPLPADYDGDGDADIAVFRPSVGGWYRAGAATVFFGLSGDIPVAADYDGDGDADIAVFRPAVGGWYLSGGATQYVGLSGDIPVPGDYGGDGSADIAVFRPATGAWYVGAAPPAFLGVNGDRPLPLPTAVRQVFFP